MQTILRVPVTSQVEQPLLKTWLLYVRCSKSQYQEQTTNELGEAASSPRHSKAQGLSCLEDVCRFQELSSRGWPRTICDKLPYRFLPEEIEGESC